MNTVGGHRPLLQEASRAIMKCVAKRTIQFTFAARDWIWSRISMLIFGTPKSAD
jgi:hypothetical protein